MSKNIHDLSDDEFDDLFRESAEKDNIGFDPDAWKKMSQKLDAVSDPPSSSGKLGNALLKWGLPLVVLLLLLIIGSYFLIRKPSEPITTKVKAKESTLKRTDIDAQKYVSTDKVATQNKENAIDNTVSGSNTKVDKIGSEKIKQNKTENKEVLNISDSREIQVSNKSNSKIVLSSPKNIGIVKDNSRKKTEESADLLNNSKFINTAIVKNKTINDAESEKLPNNEIEKTAKQISYTKQNSNRNAKTQALLSETPTSEEGLVSKDLNSSQNSVADSVSTIQQMQWASVAVLSPTKHSFAIDLKLPVISFQSSFETPIVKPKENTAFRRGLNVRLALSPDFSFIPSNEVLKIGNNWAAVVEYRFNNRLSIQAGVMRSLKLYNALPSQYEWTGYYNPPSPIIDIDATCKMLDIPLNIRYDLSQKANSRWFVSTGLTTYIMLKEKYRYNYENPSDPNIKRIGWEGKTGAYPFGVLNLSAGYERQIFRRLTFQAEPFFKTPLGKVGYGKVRLATAGVFFSAKYPF